MALRVICMTLASLVLAVTVHPVAAARAAVGSPVPATEMPTADGGRASPLRDVEANVLVFFRPGQDRSVSALRELADCQKGLEGKSVHWAAVVSGSAAPDQAAGLVREARFAGPTLIDAGDALYGALGLELHPVVVIVGRDRKLAAFESFRTLDFCTVVRARIRHVLREIGDDELRAALDPPKATQGGAAQVAQRYRALAESLLRSGSLDKALENARKSIERDATQAGVHALLGDILRAQGNCDEARSAYERALSLDTTQAAARGGLEQCKAAR